jgi:predicted glycosyltransferase
MTRHRILFYSHDSFGLGHFRRSLTIASYLSRHLEHSSILMLTGLDSPASFETPPGVDFVKLPSIWKAGPDQYCSRHLRVSFQRVLRMREHLLRTVARAFDPALVIVDNVPRGVDGELLPMLRHLRKHRPQTRIMLTLRDVLDSPKQIVPQWKALGVHRILKHFYDEIWIAGSQSVFDPVTLYEFPAAVADLVKFCGYVVRSSPPGEADDLRREFRLGGGPLVVVSCGGGGDGHRLIQTYIDAALPLARKGVQSAVFLGPDMPPTERRALKQRLLPLSEHFLTFDFRPDLVSFLRIASASVSMAGYNTVCELAAIGTPALVVPRTYPRVEQLLRAQAFAARGLLRCLPPEDLDPPRLRAALQEMLELPVARDRQLPAGMDFAGLTRIGRRVRKHLRIAEASDGDGR